MAKRFIVLPKISMYLDSKYNLLPGSCNSCHKIISTRAEDPFCNKCKSLVALCGSFQLKRRAESNYLHNFYYPLDFLKDNSFGLTMENVVMNSDLSASQKVLVKMKPTLLDRYELNFVVDFSKKYYCPKCQTINLKISPGLITWD